MQLKGFEKFREKTPWFAGKKILLLPLYFTFMMALSITVLIWFDSIPEKVTSTHTNFILSLFPLFGELIVAIIGLSMVYQMWAWRERLKARWGNMSYQRIVLAGFGGVVWILSLSINLFLHYWSFSPLFWTTSPLRFLTLPLETYASGAEIIIFWLRIILAALFLIVGLLMALRSLQTFGFDYMTVVYLYFPEESKIQNYKIYSILRHPMYAAALTIGLGGMFYTFTIYSIIFFIVYLALFYIHVHFVEEKELIKRFGASYQEYLKTVPAFFVNPSRIGILLGFLIRSPNYK
jgi:protein-S-isoprenylcysteine O-methyltransferase Ste14